MNATRVACQQADHLAEVGRYAEAERIARAALGQAPDDVELLTMLGFVLRMQERYVDALAACDAAVALAPDWGPAHAERAGILLDIHRSAEAIAAAAEAVRLGPHSADRHVMLAKALAAEERFDEARASVREALRLAPRSAAALVTLAEIERWAGNPGASGAPVRAALAIEPTSTRGRWMLAMLDADRGAVRRSVRTLAEVARDRPATPDLDSLVWPIRRSVVAPRWWLPGAAAVVAGTALVAANVNPYTATVIGVAARVAAGLACAVAVGFLLRLLVPAGRLPWQALRLSPPLVRRSLGVGLATIAVVLGLLAGYAAGGPVVLPILAVAAAPVLWACMMGEMVGRGLNDAGGRQFIQEWLVEFRGALGALRDWPAETRRELRSAWNETGTDIDKGAGNDRT